MRKVWEHSGLVHERIYLGGYEVWREHTGSISSPPAPDEERETLHISDDARRVCMVETLTITSGSPVGSPTPRYRYQYDNHLGTACVECDTAGLVISYEEYHPYGTSSYRSFQSSEVSSKRYRYTGKERDEETSLYYHGARYYAPWLGRWCSADPAGTVDGTNLYAYVRGSPIGLVDPNGMQANGDLPPEMRAQEEAKQRAAVATPIKPAAPAAPEGGEQQLKVAGPLSFGPVPGSRPDRGPILVPEDPSGGLDVDIEKTKAAIRANDAQRGAAIVAERQAAEAARKSPGELHAEVHNLGEKGGEPLKFTIELIAGEAVVAGVVKAGRALKQAGKLVARGVDLEVKVGGSLGLDALEQTARGADEPFKILNKTHRGSLPGIVPASVEI